MLELYRLLNMRSNDLTAPRQFFLDGTSHLDVSRHNGEVHRVPSSPHRLRDAHQVGQRPVVHPPRQSPETCCSPLTSSLRCDAPNSRPPAIPLALAVHSRA